MILSDTEARDEAVGPIQQVPLPEPEPEPSLKSVLGSALRVQNTVLSAGVALGTALERRQLQARRTALGEELEPDYNPLQDIAGYEPWARSFRDAESREEVALVKRTIDREIEDRRILDAGGAAGVVAQIAAGVVDPINLIPVTGTAVRSARLGGQVLEGAGRTALVGAGVAVAAEAALQATQETRTVQESAITIGASALISGILGGALPLVRPGLAALTRQVERDLTLPAPGRPDPLEPGAIELGPQDFAPAGAMAVQKIEAKLKGALGVEKLLKFSSPILRTVQSPSATTRRAAVELVETPFYLTDNAAGVASPVAVETRITFWQAPLAESLEELDRLYIAHKQSSYPAKLGSFLEFKEEVGRAMRQGDQHPIPQVEAAARFFREKVFDPLKLQAVKVGLLPEDVQVVGADSYLTRVYNTRKVSARRAEFVESISNWLKVDQEYRLGEAVRQRAKVDPYRPGREQIGVERVLDPLELREAAEDITDHILGVAEGRIAYESVKLARGPLMERTLNAPDYLLEPFLESDIELIAKFYARTMSSDVEITRAFGSPDMAARIGEIRDSYKDLVARAGSETERVKLGKQRDADIRDLAAMRDRLRGTYRAPADPDSFLVRSGQAVRNWNYISMMGSVVLSSLTDLARPVMIHGVLATVRDGIVPLISGLRQFRLAANETKMAGAALDLTLNSRAMELADVGSIYGRHSKFERGLQAIADRFGDISAINYWNSGLKQFSSVVTQHNLLRSAMKGEAMSAREIEDLAMSGINAEMAGRIAAQFEKHGDRSTATWLANTRQWEDREAVKHFRAAIVKDVDRIIVTPGAGDRPLWMSWELGKVVGQFHSYFMAATQRVLLAGLQQRDAAALNGALMMVGLGMFQYYLVANQVFSLGQGEKRKKESKALTEDPATWVKEGVERSGIFGWLYEATTIGEKATRGVIGPTALAGGEISQRYAERGVIGSVAGPTFSRAEDVLRATGALSQEAADELGVTGKRGFSEVDVKALRRLIPFQNLFYLRWLFDQAQEGAKDVLVD